MKTSEMDATLGPLMDSLDPDVELWKCHQCGQCSSICPSYRNGGIRTREIMELALLGGLDPGSESSIWMCTMCNSCTERCQLGVDPARVIEMLRNLASRKGNAPEHFRKEATLFISTGLSFPVTGLTKKLRKEMELEPLEISERAMGDLRVIVELTTMGELGVE